MNLPNKLTLLRMCAVPVVIACFYIPWKYATYVAAALFVLAFITDIIDGKYARKHNLVTNFGKLMDPMADKLMMTSTFIMLSSVGMIPALATVIIVAREFVISAYRMVAVNESNVIAASWLGKTKTTLQCVAAVLAMLHNPLELWTSLPLDKIVLWASVIMAVWSAVDYIVKNKIKLEI